MFLLCRLKNPTEDELIYCLDKGYELFCLDFDPLNKLSGSLELIEKDLF